MRDTLREIDDIPVTLVVAIAYGTLAVVTGMGQDPEQFGERLHTYGSVDFVSVAAGEPWRLFTYAFLHGNFVHLLLNLAALWSLGPGLERSLGSLRYLLLYVVAAIGGGAMVCLFQEAAVGGSGALFGMLGAIVAINMRAGRHLFAFLDFEGPRRMLANIAAMFVIGMIWPIISNTGHAGGLIAGFVLTFLWLRPGAVSPSVWHWRAATTALFAGLVLWCVMPVTRHDSLQREWHRTSDPARREALERAYVRATR